MLRVNEKPGTTIVIEPFPRHRQLCFPFVVRVSDDQHIIWPVENTGKTPKIVKVGTYLADYTKVDPPENNPRQSVNQVKDLV